MDRLDLGALFLHFLILWFVAIGGPSTILPDIQRYLVEVHHLLTNTQFAVPNSTHWRRWRRAPTPCTSP